MRSTLSSLDLGETQRGLTKSRRGMKMRAEVAHPSPDEASACSGEMRRRRARGTLGKKRRWRARATPSERRRRRAQTRGGGGVLGRLQARRSGGMLKRVVRGGGMLEMRKEESCPTCRGRACFRAETWFGMGQISPRTVFQTDQICIPWKLSRWAADTGNRRGSLRGNGVPNKP
jgi:hypothetical protein